jgi:hypothetical protein
MTIQQHDDTSFHTPTNAHASPLFITNTDRVTGKFASPPASSSPALAVSTGVPAPLRVNVSIASCGTRPRVGSVTASAFAESWMMWSCPVHAGMPPGPCIVSEATLPVVLAAVAWAQS